MKLYSENQRPFVYAVFSDTDEKSALSVLQQIHEEDGVSFWFSDRFLKKEIKRIEAAYSCILFISKKSILDEKVYQCIEYAVRFNKKILCIYLEPAALSLGQELLLNSLQSVDKSTFPDEKAFIEKLKSAEVFSGLQITSAQKRFAKRKGLASVFVPVGLAAIVFLTVVVPLLVIPIVQASTGSLSKIGFGNLSLTDLAKVDHLYVIGDQSFDQWYFAFYTDQTKQKVYVNDLDATLPIGNISDISDLALLKNAKDIAIEANNVSDISPLYKIKTLEGLTVNCNPVKSIEGIEALQNLTDATLVFTEISDISPLFKIPSLRNISFENTYVSSIEGIENLKHLEGLRTGNSNLTDISPLNKIDFSYINDTGGFSFEAKGTLIRDFSPLGRIPKFREVSVDLPRIEDILPYITGKEVHHVKIAGSDISSVAAFSSIEYLDVLFLGGSYSLSSLEGIESHETLQEIELVHCPNITDFTPLLDLPNLQRLIVSQDMKGLVSAQLAGADFEILYTEEGV